MHKENLSGTFKFPPSIQSELFNRLHTEQQEFVKPVLRILKKPAQEEMCCALLDYLESGQVIPPADITLGGLFFYVIDGVKNEPSADSRRSCRTRSIGSIIKQLLNPSPSTFPKL